MTDPLYSVSASTTPASGARSLGIQSDRENHPKKKKIIMSSTGTERKNSTTAPHSQRTGASEDRRPMPKTRPKMPARITDRVAAFTVSHRSEERRVGKECRARRWWQE